VAPLMVLEIEDRVADEFLQKWARCEADEAEAIAEWQMQRAEKDALYRRVNGAED
jgi:hypothetical protein